MNTGTRVTSLTTDRTLIREHGLEDWIEVEGYSLQERFWRFLQVGELKEGSGKEFIERALKEQEQTPRVEYNLAIAKRDSGQLIGSIRLGQIDRGNRQCILGYAINPAYWGQGYATESVRRLVAFGFAELGLHRIVATCDIENQASRRVLDKIGMTREGLMREDSFSQGEWRSSYLYSMLEHEQG